MVFWSEKDKTSGERKKKVGANIDTLVVVAKEGKMREYR